MQTHIKKRNSSEIPSTQLQKSSFQQEESQTNLHHSLPKQKLLIKERDQARIANPADPRIDDLNKEINTIIKNHKKDKWIEHLHDCDPGSKKLWQTIKSLEAIPPPPANQSISFNGIYYDKAQQIANNLKHTIHASRNLPPSKIVQKPFKNHPKTAPQ